MKKFIAIAAVVMGFVVNALPSDRLIDALVQVESSGRPTVVGDNGKAVGILQIHKCVVDDVNRIYNTTYTYADRLNPTKSREIAKKYLSHYGGQNATDEKYARIWNGGPRGHLKKATEKYWSKVKKALGSK